jgi:hypothetical protein
MMIKFGSWWGRRNPIPIVERHGPRSELCWLREPGWFEYFAVVAPCEADHATHAHVVVTEDLTVRDEYMLKKYAEKRGLKVNISRNSDDWLAGKKGVEEHACKVGYVVNHLRRWGSDFRMSSSQTPAWVRRARGAQTSAGA